MLRLRRFVASITSLGPLRQWSLRNKKTSRSAKLSKAQRSSKSGLHSFFLGDPWLCFKAFQSLKASDAHRLIGSFQTFPNLLWFFVMSRLLWCICESKSKSGPYSFEKVRPTIKKSLKKALQIYITEKYINRQRKQNKTEAQTSASIMEAGTSGVGKQPLPLKITNVMKFLQQKNSPQRKTKKTNKTQKNRKTNRKPNRFLLFRASWGSLRLSSLRPPGARRWRRWKTCEAFGIGFLKVGVLKL